MLFESSPLMLVRPQPVGIYRGAAAYLLLPVPAQAGPPGEVYSQTLSELLRGNFDIAVPEGWEFYLAAARGQTSAACELLERSWNLKSRETRPETSYTFVEQWLAYNRFVLGPDASSWSRLQAVLVDPQLKSLAQAAAYAYGLTDDLPTASCLSDELKAWYLAVGASKQIEQQNLVAARQMLIEAIGSAQASPLLVAILLAQSAQLAEQSQLPAELIRSDLQRAIELAQSCHLPGFLAELYAQLGMLLQRVASENRHELLAAVRAYQMALQSGISSETNPTAFAELQNNLGLAYLSMPSNETSSQLRTGIAIQSFQRARDAVDSQTNGELWARINMNLANALQYAPSSHPAENLMQAVNIYEQVLEVRSRARDPVAYALVVLNQANALAHLGIFKPALEKAAEAYKLFQWYNQADAAATARELVENVNICIESAHATASREPVSTNTNEQELQHGTV